MQGCCKWDSIVFSTFQVFKFRTAFDIWVVISPMIVHLPSTWLSTQQYGYLPKRFLTPPAWLIFQLKIYPSKQCRGKKVEFIVGKMNICTIGHTNFISKAQDAELSQWKFYLQEVLSQAQRKPWIVVTFPVFKR